MRLVPFNPAIGHGRVLGHGNGMATNPQVSRWKHDRPPSLQQFMATFPDDDACAGWLEQRRWPDGFVCPCCHARKGWKLETKPWTFECAGCGEQTSVTAGTILHGTHLPLRTWFIAAHLVATHSNGVSALQLQGKLGIGSYKAALPGDSHHHNGVPPNPDMPLCARRRCCEGQYDRLV
jgi:hypothetical protein